MFMLWSVVLYWIIYCTVQPSRWVDKCNVTSLFVYQTIQCLNSESNNTNHQHHKNLIHYT